jgi:hypothetical protein
MINNMENKITISITKPVSEKRPIRFGDLKKGDFFQYFDGTAWFGDIYLMMDPSLNVSEQTINISEANTTFFNRGENTEFRIFTEINFRGMVSEI